MPFRVDLDVFRGPLDLLLYLVRKHELDILEIPISLIADQYLAHLDVLKELDIDSVGDFLVLASTLLEIKSRTLLPRNDETPEGEPLVDLKQELVTRLLEYKQFKDVAVVLEERGRSWRDRFPRLDVDAGPRAADPAEQPIREVELWDLVSAFGRILRENQSIPTSSIVYDDTPIHVYMSRIQARLRERGTLAFSELFQPGMHKSTLVGIFLALLELVRNHGVRTEQSELFGEIHILPGQDPEIPPDPSRVDNYDHPREEGV